MAQQYTDEIKAQVIGEWQTGTVSKGELARKYGIPKGTVQGWTRALETAARLSPQKEARDELGRLVYEYLTVGLESLIAQAKKASEPGFIEANGATIHLIHGVFADKLILVLRALELGSESAGSSQGTIDLGTETAGAVIPA